LRGLATGVDGRFHPDGTDSAGEPSRSNEWDQVATWATVSEIVGALPGAVLDSPERDNPAWRVRDAVLVRRNPRLRVPDEDSIRNARGELVAIRVDRREREAVLQEDPTTFFVTPHWQSSPFVLAWLATVDPVELRELLVDGWRFLAPKRAVRAWDEAQAQPG
jgi:hypothetical protein